MGTMKAWLVAIFAAAVLSLTATSFAQGIEPPSALARMLGLGHPPAWALAVAAGFSAATALIIGFIGRRRWQRVAVAMCVIGFLVPALSGAAVKLWLQAHGRPTAPWSTFRLYPIIGIILAAPVGGLAVVAHRCLSRAADDAARGTWLWLFGGAVTGTVASMTLIYAEVFSSRHWSDVLVFAPLLWPSYLPGALLGGATGWAMHRASTTLRDRRSVPSC